MFETLTEILPELFYAVLAGALTVFGLFVESLGAQNFSGGNTIIGAWMTVVGVVALYAAIKLVREKALPGLRTA